MKWFDLQWNLLIKLVNNEGDPEIVNLLNAFDFYILPSANPDGYDY